MTLVILYWTTVLACWVRTEIVGGSDEKTCVRAVLVCSLLTKVFMRPFAVRYVGLEWRVIPIDVLLLAVLIAIVVRSRRYWPIWATGFQVVDLLTHFAAISGVSRRAYALALGFWAYAILAAAMTGTARRHHRLSA